MKKRSLIGALICAASLAVTTIMPNVVMADATKVVTLGADLSDEQKSTMMKYFKANRDEVQIIFVTNADEKRLLGNYIPAAQIGNRTVSCAYVRPTSSGGIKVRTANLNYVTCNMIATTLSTSGVSNCEVVAACPFEVSGTGALTGIMMAYEEATGEKLDEKKKDIAAHEMVVTKELSENIESNKDAINIINSGKMEVVGNDIQNAEEIQNVVINIAQENNVNISKEQVDKIVELLEEIAKEDYNYDDMKETLENVEANVNDDIEVNVVDDDDIEVGSAVETEDNDEISILVDVDVTVLGNNVLESSTEDTQLEVDTGLTELTEAVVDDDDWEEWDVFEEGDDDMQVIDAPEEEWDTPEEEWDDPEGLEEEEELIDEQSPEEEDELNLDLLTEEQREKFETLVKFCRGEFDGDIATLKEVMEDDNAFPRIVLDTDLAEKLTKDVLKCYYELLLDGVEDYVPTSEDEYFAPELNIMVKELKKLLNLDEIRDYEHYLEIVPEEDRQILYEDVVKFFEKLYDEVREESWEDEPAAYEESGEDMGEGMDDEEIEIID